MTSQILKKLEGLRNEEKALILRGFFKTGPGRYGEGDVFLGIQVPILRKLAGQFPNAGLETALPLLAQPFHEARLLALLLFIQSFRRGTAEAKGNIFRAYLENTRYINNWDLVDLSAPHIVGAYLADKERSLLIDLASSAILWERRIAIVSTFHLIRNGEFADTLRISDLLLHDREDLIHKAVGWMLREVGKRDPEELEAFLRDRHQVMPRTMLRYAIERFAEGKRQKYLKGFKAIPSGPAS